MRTVRRDKAALWSRTRRPLAAALWAGRPLRLVSGTLPFVLASVVAAPPLSGDLPPLPPVCSSYIGVREADGTGTLRRMGDTPRTLQRFRSPLVGLGCVWAKDQLSALTADGRVWFGVPGDLRQIGRARGHAPFALSRIVDPTRACRHRSRQSRPEHCHDHIAVLSTVTSVLGQPGTLAQAIDPQPHVMGRTVAQWFVGGIVPRVAADLYPVFAGERDGRAVVATYVDGRVMVSSDRAAPERAGPVSVYDENKHAAGVSVATGRAWLRVFDSIGGEGLWQVELPGPPVAEVSFVQRDQPVTPSTYVVVGRARGTGAWLVWRVRATDGHATRLHLPAVQGRVVNVTWGHRGGLTLVVQEGTTYRAVLWTPE